jgi:GT2 family glycosyltransferase
MTSTPPELSILISSHNTRALLDTCLRSVLDDVGRGSLRAEIIVVDDDSNDGSAEMVEQRFPDVILIRCDGNQGYARANNIGIARSSGKSIFLLNSDTIVLPGALRAMVSALERRSDIGAVGPVLVNTDGSLQRSCWPFPLRGLIGNSLLLFRAGVWDDYRSWSHPGDRVVDCISSAALLIRREALEQAGLLDEHFWVYGVDIDWALRARRKGYRCLSISGARVVHYGGASWSHLPLMAADHLNSHLRLFRKHYGPVGVALFRSLVFLNSVTRLCVWGLLSILGRPQVRTKVDYFRLMARWSLRGITSDLSGAGSIPP